MMSKLVTVISKLSSSGEGSKVYFSSFDSPVGNVIAAADNDNIYIVVFEDTKNIEKKFEALSTELSCQFVEEKNKILLEFEKQLSHYFEGKLKKFMLPVKLIGSEFQKAVWNKIVNLPYGSTETYGALAKALGRSPSHSRAVGAACGANPLLLVVPCHRLISSGSKGGYNSGVDRKDKLIQHEKQWAC